MALFKGIFKNIFSGVKNTVQQVMHSAFLLNNVPYYTNATDNVYDIAVARACIHTIATHSAKLQFKHTLNDELLNSDLQYLLGTRPNKYMSSFEFMYKTVTMLLTSNNAFIFCDWDEQSHKLDALYPIPYNSVELLEYKNNFYIKFRCLNHNFTLPYEDIIHIRRHFGNDDFMGAKQTDVLTPTVKMNNAITESIVNGVRTSNGLQGIIKYKQLADENDLKIKIKEFTDNYMSISNTARIAGLDNKYEFQQLKLEPVLFDDKQMQAVEGNLYKYYNVSENIVESKYSESEYNAFYNSNIEPLSIQLSQEFSSKLLSVLQIKKGEKITLSAERMGFASMETRVKAIETLMPLGVFSINDSRRLMELPKIDNGDKYLVSLNYVDLDNQNKYQVGEQEQNDKK